MSRAPSPAELRPKWQDLPATAQVDAALRRAAAGVCGMKWPPYDERHINDWSPHQNRDHLARVFVAGNEMRKKARYESMTKLHGQAIWWASSLLPLHTLAQTDPRAALCSLFDLLAIPVPEGLTNE